jgi:hypothetical protein
LGRYGRAAYVWDRAAKAKTLLEVYRICREVEEEERLN